MDWADWLMIAVMVALIAGFIAVCVVAFGSSSGGGDTSTACFYMTNVGFICT